MKVLQINSCFGCLSTGRIVSDIAAELVASGHECVAAYGLDYMDRGIPTIKIGTRLGIKFNTLYSRLFDREGFGAWFATRRFLKKVDAYQPDLVHLHNLHGNYINIKLLFEYLAEKKIPTVLTLHDCWFLTGHCAHFLETGCEKWKSCCDKCPQLSSYPKSYFLDRSADNHRIKSRLLGQIPELEVVTICEWSANLVRQSHLKQRPQTTIFNGIDLNCFRPIISGIREELRLGDRKMVLGVASSWSNRKGLSDFVALAETISSDYQIVLIGLTEEQRDSLPKSIIGITRTSNAEELAAYYSAADVFVNLSYEDTFATVNIEAQACGTPVVTYLTAGNPETVCDQTGIVVGQGDIEEVTCTIQNLVSKEKPVQACTDYAKEQFDRKKQAQRYLDVYRHFLK